METGQCTCTEAGRLGNEMKLLDDESGQTLAAEGWVYLSGVRLDFRLVGEWAAKG